MNLKLPSENGERKLLLSWGQGVGYGKKAAVGGGERVFALLGNTGVRGQSDED